MIIKIGCHVFVFTLQHKIVYTIPDSVYKDAVHAINDGRKLDVIKLLRMDAGAKGFNLKLQAAWDWIDGGCRGRVLEVWRKDSSGMEFDT